MRKYFSILFLLVLCFHHSSAQDSTTTHAQRYSSIGFQCSFVSGIGISYGVNEAGKYRVRVTGGIITSGDKAYYSFGADYHFELTNNSKFKVFIGPSIGTIGTSTDAPTPRLGLATGVENPLTGNTIYQNISAGLIVYYPTYFFQSSDISFAGGFFIAYNF